MGESVPVAASKRNCLMRLPPRLVASTKRLEASGWMAWALGSVGTICLGGCTVPSGAIGFTVTLLLG